MPKTLAELFGDTEATPVEAAPTPGPTPVPAPAPDISTPEPAATPPQTGGPTLAQLLGTPEKVVKGAGAILDPSVRTASVPTTLSQTADDRTIMQRYGLGTVRQATAAFLDYSTGIPFAGVSWLAAGMQAASRAMPPGMSDALQFAAKNINKGVGEGLHLIEEVAGRPVVEIPSWVPVVGGQDAIRTIGMFAPLPFVAGEQMAAKGGMAALKTFGKAFGIQLAFTEAGAVTQLAQAETKEQTYNALVEMGKGIGSAAVATAFFGGIGALTETINKQRVQYALNKAKGAVPPVMTGGEAALGTAIAQDANTGGTLIGDELARAKANLAEVHRKYHESQAAPDEVRVFHGTGAVFEKFDINKVGTGEGAQVYGHGLYFSDNPDVALSYKQKLEPGRGLDSRDMAARALRSTGGDTAEAIKWLEERKANALDRAKDVPEVAEGMPETVKLHIENQLAEFQGFAAKSEEAIRHIEEGTAEGKMFSVGLKKAEIAKMLEYDAPMKDQPKAADAIRTIIESRDSAIKKVQLESFEKNLKDGTSAGTMIELFVGRGDPGGKRWSKALSDAGFTGVKYLDQGSRGREGPGLTHNYVVFDDKALRVLKPIEGMPKGRNSTINERFPGQFFFGDHVATEDGREWNIIKESPFEGNAGGPPRLRTDTFYEIASRDKGPDGMPEYSTVHGLDLKDLSPVYDPEVGAKAIRLKDGSVVMSTHMTHDAVAIEIKQRGLWDKVTDRPEDVGRIWGPEKRFYSEEEYFEGQRLKASREAALVEAETMERAAKIASDAAAQANAPTDPNIKTGAMALLKHAKEGGSSVNFDLEKLPNVKEEWKHYGSLKYMYEQFVLKPFNHLLTPDQQSNLRWTIGEYNKVLRDGIAEATEFRGVLERIFPYLTPDQRAKGVANLGYQAQIALGLAETKYSKGDRVLTQDNKAWEITRKTSDGKWVIESGKESRTVPEDALKAYGPLQRDAARQGFTPDQLHALDVGIRDFLNTLHARAVTAGAMKADSYIKDYFIRAFKPPPGWEKVRVEGFLNTFLTAEAATNEHALHRVFRLYEEAVSEGFIPATNHVGTMVYNYAVSMAESTARSIARSSSVKQLHELGLTSKVKPNENWIKVEKSQAPEFEDVFIPRDAFKMLRPMLETRGGLDLIDKADKWNHMAKRFGLGLDFYNSMNILRGIVSVGFNPKTIFQLGKYNEYWEQQHPTLLTDAIQGGLNLGIPTDYVARDQAFERDTKLSGGESMREAVREGKYGEAPKRLLMKARGIFYWIEENAVQNLLETGKKAAFYKEYAESKAKAMSQQGRDLTPIEDQRLIQSTAKNVNTLFGGQNLEQMGRSKMARVGLRMLLLSPDWTESRLRMYATGMKEGFQAGMAPIRAAFGDHAALSALNHENTGNVKYAVRLFAATLLATEAMNLALNQKTTLSNDKGNEFYVQLPMKTKYGTSPSINLWGYQEMPIRLMHHMVNMQPEAFLNERQAPALNTAFALLASQDNFGEKLKGEVAFMRPPVTEREKNMKIALQKGMLVAGQVIPSVLTDLLVATDRTMRDGAIDSVRFARSVANFIGIKISSNYPQEIRTKMDFLEENAVRTRGEYKRLIAAGQWREAIEMKREWNDEVDTLKRSIYSDPTLRTAFRKRTDTITTFKIR